MPTTVMATALPYSLAEEAPFQLSVYFTHKLTDGGRLSDYPAAADWVTTLQDCELHLAFITAAPEQAFTSLPLRIVSHPDPEAWRALLPGTLRVDGFPEPTLSSEPIRSNPASRMSDHAIDAHFDAIGTSPGSMPGFETGAAAWNYVHTFEDLDPDGPITGLREHYDERNPLQLISKRLLKATSTLLSSAIADLNVSDEERIYGPEKQPTADPVLDVAGSALDEFLGDTDTDRRISEQLDDWAKEEFQRSPAIARMLDAHAMRRYYERPESQAPERPVAPEPEFHARVSSFGSVPALLRRLGLVVDVVLDELSAEQARTLLSGVTHVTVQMTSSHPDLEILPARSTATVADGDLFQARSRGEWEGGALPLGEPEWVVLETDPDSGGLKLEQYLRDLPRQLAAAANGDPATTAPGSIRSTGFALARRDRLAQTRARLTQAEQLASRNESSFELEDVVRGFRVEVWDDQTGVWHSLHRRRVDVTAMPDGTTVLSDAPDVGFLQSSGLHRDNGQLYLHEVIAGWDGWSLSAPRPGLIVERVPDPAPGEPTERIVAAPSDLPLDGAHVVSRVEPGSLPRLRYGTSYSFRVLAVDLAGNSTPLPGATSSTGTRAPVGRIKKLRQQFQERDAGGMAAHAKVAEALLESPPDPVTNLRSLLTTGEASIDQITQVLLDTLPPTRPNPSDAGANAAAHVLQSSGRPIRVRPHLEASDEALEEIREILNRPHPERRGDPARDIATLPRPYLRWEPIGPPVIVAKEELDPGEQLSVLVVRSGSSADRDRSERHLAAPKATQMEAETAGHFDDAIGTSDLEAIRRLYSVALAERGTLLDEQAPSLTDPDNPIPQQEARLVQRPGANPDDQITLADIAADRGRPLGEGQYVVHGVDELRLPYLPEPFADGASLVFFEAGAGHQISAPGMLRTVRVPYPGGWPERTPLRLVVSRGDEFDAHVEGNVVQVAIPPGEQVRAMLSSTLKPDALNQLGLWRSYHAHKVDPTDGLTEEEWVAMLRLERDAVSGWLWWLTPSTPVRLVHAIPEPVRPPEFRGLWIFARPMNRGMAALTGAIDLHGPSTDTLVVRAEWSEMIDDPSQPEPVRTTTSDVVVRSSVGERQRTGLLHLIDLNAGSVGGSDIGLHKAIQIFPDTHRRLVSYHPGGTTRYAEYFDSSELPATLTEGQPAVLDIPSSARPAAPIVLDAVPLLRWSGEPEPGTPFGWRRTRGSGIRIWLNRPWFSSGDGELLGVLLFDGTKHQQNQDRWPVPPNGAASIWAADPILWNRVSERDPWSLPLLGDELLGLEEVTKLAMTATVGLLTPLGREARVWPPGPAQPVAMATDIPLLDVPGQPRMRVVGYQPEYDTASRRWFVDIAMHESALVSPFIRLAVARWQPHSLPGCELSAVALTPWVQPLPERVLTVNRVDALTVQVTLSGVASLLRDNERITSLVGNGMVTADSPVGDDLPSVVKLPLSRQVSARIESLPEGGTDLDWQHQRTTQLVPVKVDAKTGNATWTSSITLSEAVDMRRPGVDGSRWRVVVEEKELLDGDHPSGLTGTAPRLVYSDEITL